MGNQRVTTAIGARGLNCTKGGLEVTPFLNARSKYARRPDSCPGFSGLFPFVVLTPCALVKTGSCQPEMYVIAWGE